MFRVYLLVACICVLIASVLYTFYFNRLLAATIGLFLRIRYWNSGGSSIWVQIGESSTLEYECMYNLTMQCARVHPLLDSRRQNSPQRRSIPLEQSDHKSRQSTGFLEVLVARSCD